MRPAPSIEESIIIVGAGVFGLSTALELRLRGFHNITVLDRMLPPVPDGSSVDISRIIRCDYTDIFYASMAREAIDAWNSKDWNQYYHNSGFVMSSQTPQDPFIEKCKEVLRSQQHPVTIFETPDELTKMYPTLEGGMQGSSGYVNLVGGWADAAGAIRHLAARCSEAGVSFMTGSRGTVQSLVVEESRVVGVRTACGPVYGDRVILATGAWTNRLVNLASVMSSSAQPVGFIQLTAEEATLMSKMPVVIEFTSGFFIFPPTPGSHLLKIARHSHGFETRVEVDGGVVVSAPKYSNNAISSFLPQDADAALREGMRYLLPQFVDRPWLRRRLCWYTDTPEGNFIVDGHPSIDGLFIAAGGAGHAFKFLPVLGRYIADCFENKAPPEVSAKWKLPEATVAGGYVICNDGSRRGPPKRLLLDAEQARL